MKSFYLLMILILSSCGNERKTEKNDAVTQGPYSINSSIKSFRFFYKESFSAPSTDPNESSCSMYHLSTYNDSSSVNIKWGCGDETLNFYKLYGDQDISLQPEQKILLDNSLKNIDFNHLNSNYTASRVGLENQYIDLDFFDINGKKISTNLPMAFTVDLPDPLKTFLITLSDLKLIQTEFYP